MRKSSRRSSRPKIASKRYTEYAQQLASPTDSSDDIGISGKCLIANSPDALLLEQLITTGQLDPDMTPEQIHESNESFRQYQFDSFQEILTDTRTRLRNDGCISRKSDKNNAGRKSSKGNTGTGNKAWTPAGPDEKLLDQLISSGQLDDMSPTEIRESNDRFREYELPDFRKNLSNAKCRLNRTKNDNSLDGEEESNKTAKEKVNEEIAKQARLSPSGKRCAYQAPTAMCTSTHLLKKRKRIISDDKNKSIEEEDNEDNSKQSAIRPPAVATPSPESSQTKVEFSQIICGMLSINCS